MRTHAETDTLKLIKTKKAYETRYKHVELSMTRLKCLFILVSWRSYPLVYL